MKRFLFTILCSLVTLLSFAQSVCKTMLRLPDTGETTSYTNTFGEDNDYNINSPFFITNGNGTVTDTLTGLMWQQTDGGEMTIENARIYCDTLTLGGYTNWRLPNAHESFSILNHQHANPALDNNVFTNTSADYWWTANVQANDSNKIWVTNAGGGIGNHPKSETISAGGNKKFHVRAIRDVTAPTTIPSQFTDNGDGTITDHLTDLVWQKVPSSDSITWEDALAYADTLTSAGDTSWRLPNIKELQSINDESIIAPSVNHNYFTGITVSKYWSSTTLPNHTTEAWYLDTQFGITTYDVKTIKHYVLCVHTKKDSVTGIAETSISDSPTVISPNPFTSKIQLPVKFADTPTRLCNSVGLIIYEGNNIGGQDFSRLPQGIYYLWVQHAGIAVKLIKQ